MANFITAKEDEIKEGEIFCRWMRNRLIYSNKNILGAELGATGSGKSYRDLRKAELWYDYQFEKEFPEENICFGVASVMEILANKKLRKGEVIIFEEAGVNLGSLDFQTKISKMMNYILQSFRSMNIAIFFNLPYLTMLNKSARMLLHYSFESAGIDKENGINTCKPFFHQVNQATGKIYKKYPTIKVNGKLRKIQRFSFKMPSKRLIDAYEKKKSEYLESLTKEYSKEIERIKNKEGQKYNESIFNDTETDYIALHKKFKGNMKEVAEFVGVSVQNAYYHFRKAKMRELKSLKPIGAVST